MSATVIEFAKHQKGHATMSEATACNLGDNRSRRRDARRAIHAAVERNRKFSGSRDAVIVAERLTRMLDVAKTLGNGPAAVAREVWKDDPSPQKRLHKFTVSRQGPDQTESRLANLNRSPRQYAAIAKAIAKLTKRDASDMLLDLFRGTSVEAAMNSTLGRRAETDLDDCWEDLSAWIHRMAEDVAVKTGLARHLQSISSEFGRFDVANQTMVSSGYLILKHGPLADNFEAMDEYPPIPSVPLFERLLVPRFQRTMRLSHTSDEYPLTDVQVDVEVYREVRLAIGPSDQVAIPRPLFEVRTRVDLLLDSQPLPVRWPWLYLTDGHVENIEVNFPEGHIWRGILELGPPNDWKVDSSSWAGSSTWVPLEGEEGEPLQPEHVYSVWYPVTAATCAQFLDHPYLGDESLRSFIALTDAETVLPKGKLGSLVEDAMFTSNPTLRSALISESAHLVALVEQFIHDRQNRAFDQHAQVLERDWERS